MRPPIQIMRVMEAPDPLLALEHDHVHLSRLVSELRSMIAALVEETRASSEGGGDGGGDGDIAGTLHALRDDLFEHFGREEEELFPYLAQAVPDLGATIARLEGAHDRICGGVSRLLDVAEKGALRKHHALVTQMFERFEGEYGEHARNEAEFLRGLSSRLDPAQRARVAEIMRAA